MKNELYAITIDGHTRIYIFRYIFIYVFYPRLRNDRWAYISEHITESRADLYIQQPMKLSDCVLMPITMICCGRGSGRSLRWWWHACRIRLARITQNKSPLRIARQKQAHKVIVRSDHGRQLTTLASQPRSTAPKRARTNPPTPATLALAVC